MAEYIDREALLKHLQECRETSVGSCPTFAVIAAIEAYVEGMLAADVAPVVHGKWIFGVSEVLGTSARRSVCGWSALAVDADMWLRYPGHHFCGACGAKMDGKDEDA